MTNVSVAGSLTATFTPMPDRMRTRGGVLSETNGTAKEIGPAPASASTTASYPLSRSVPAARAPFQTNRCGPAARLAASGLATQRPSCSMPIRTVAGAVS